MLLYCRWLWALAADNTASLKRKDTSDSFEN